MSSDRINSRATAAGTGGPASWAPASVSADTTPVSVRLQILTAEHGSLLTTRSLAWGESFSRAGMFLTTLSGAIVALALVAQATAFGDGFVLTALVILPVVLFVGIGTAVRLGVSNRHDALCVLGMNRIRGAYLELAPDMARYLVMSANDDAPGMGVTMGIPPGGPTAIHILGATPLLVGVVNSVLVGVIAGLVGIELDAPMAVIVAAGIFGFIISLALHALAGRREIAAGQAEIRAIFPTPDTTPEPEPGA